MGKLALIITTTTKPGKREEVRRLYEELLAPRATENAAQEIVVWCTDEHDPDTFHLFEIYTDRDAFGANARAPSFADYMGRVAPLLAGEPTVRMASLGWCKGL
jgi:quinol monooxygenase YgiN